MGHAVLQDGNFIAVGAGKKQLQCTKLKRRDDCERRRVELRLRKWRVEGKETLSLLLLYA